MYYAVEHFCRLKAYTVLLGKMGAETSPAEPEFFYVVNHATFWKLHTATSQRPMFTKFSHETYIGVQLRNPERHFRKFSLHGSFALPKKQFQVENRSNRRLTQSRLRDAVQRYTIYPRCSPRARQLQRSGQLVSATYGFGATGRQICPIFGFWPIFPMQNP